MTDGRDRAAAALLFAAAVALFWPATAYPLLRWDDALNISQNEWLRFDAAGVLFMAAGSRLGHWQPLTWASLALDRAVFGPGPFGHHLVNVLLHALNASLVFVLARRLDLGGSKERSFLAAAAAAALWALHPLRVESVAWATERRDVLCGALSLLAAIAYADGKERRALVLSVLAMGAKVFAVVLPLAWLVLDLRRDGKPRWKEKLAYLPFMGGALLLNMGAQAASGASIGFARFGLSQRLAQAFYGLAFYPWKSLVPAGLAPLYEPSFLLEPRPFTIAAAAVLTALPLLLLARRSNPGLVHALLAYAVLLLPVLGLFKSGRMAAADRWSYMPAIPLSLLAGAALARALEAVPARAATAALALILAVLTRAQLPVWSSDLALWKRGTEASPFSWFAVERRAEAEEAAGDAAAAATSRSYARALRRAVLERAAVAREMRGEHELAAETFKRSREDAVPGRKE